MSLFNRTQPRKTETAHHVIELNESFREILEMMNWPTEIPEEANYIAFFPDGEASYITEIVRSDDSSPFSGLRSLPHMKFAHLRFHTDLEVEV